jgi:hypothetical protein
MAAILLAKEFRGRYCLAYVMECFRKRSVFSGSDMGTPP